jgi:Flp pilus assembly protein TadD
MSTKRLVLEIAALSVLLLTNAGCQTGNGTFAPRTAVTQSDVSSDERTRDLYLSVIEQLVQYEKYHAALAHIDEFEHLFGPSPRSRALRGDAWLALGEFAAAEKEYDAIVHGPLASVGQHGLGNVSAARENWPRAVTYFEEAVREQPTNTRFLTDLGHAYSEVGRDHDAEFALKQAQELSPLALAGPREDNAPAATVPAEPPLPTQVAPEPGPDSGEVEPGQ